MSPTPSFLLFMAGTLAVLGPPCHAAATLVWRCSDTGSAPYYTNQEEETRGRKCVQVKREVLVVPSRRAREDAAPGSSTESPPRAAPRRAPSGRSYGSGFVVSETGDVVTSAHLVSACRTVHVRAGEQETAVALVASDPESDVAVIRAGRPLGRPATLRADAPLQAGEPVWVLGFPLTGVLASEINVTQGVVSATAGVGGDPKKVQITNPVQTGNSGGPLVDHSGNVVGVVAGKLNALQLARLTGELPQNVNFAIKVEAVTRLLAAAGIAYRGAAPRAPVDGVKLVQEARQYTVRVECQA